MCGCSLDEISKSIAAIKVSETTEVSKLVATTKVLVSILTTGRRSWNTLILEHECFTVKTIPYGIQG
jgi:hypothetical protein